MPTLMFNGNQLSGGIPFNQIENILGNFASPYNNVSTYVVGDLVVYEGLLYKCTTAIEVGEEWDETKWTQTDCGSEFELLNSNLEKECYFDGLDDVITITENQTYTVEKTGEYEFMGATTTTGQGFISVSNNTNGQAYNNFIYGFNGAFPTVHFRAKKGNVLSLSIAGSVTKATLKKKWRV